MKESNIKNISANSKSISKQSFQTRITQVSLIKKQAFNKNNTSIGSINILKK